MPNSSVRLPLKLFCNLVVSQFRFKEYKVCKLTNILGSIENNKVRQEGKYDGVLTIRL